MRKLKKVVRVKRPRPEKRLREPSRCSRSEVIRVKPNPDRPFVVAVHVSPTRQHMHRTIVMREGKEAIDRRCAGMVKSYTDSITGLPVVRPGLIVANMYLNAKDLKDAPAEIIAHECGHAAMAWARQQKANLSVIDGEEVMCYALGRMTQNLCNKLDKRGYFAR